MSGWDWLAWAAWGLAALWAGLLVWIGAWRVPRLPALRPPPAVAPQVVVIIPARDEAASIGAVVQAHLRARYPLPPLVVVVDDASSDGTAAIARAAAGELGAGARLLLVEGRPLPPGWTGKLWAQAQGLAAARARAPEARWLLLCDADILLGPDTLARLVALAEARGLALASLMARLDARGFWAGLLIPAFVAFFMKLYPFWRIKAARSRIAGAAGGVMLLAAEMAARLDWPASMRGALIDDCTLAARVRRAGGGLWLGLARLGEAESLRDNRALGQVWRMVARTAFTQLGHSPPALAGTLAGMGLLYVAPVALALLADGWARAGGALAWALMALAVLPVALDYRRPWAALLLPLAGLLYAAMTLDSARRHWAGAGGAWKGRTYPAGPG
jgi:hopene-associated glycosyltransferase HpnB